MSESAQGAAIDEADGVETVTFTWDDDEWTTSALAHLTGDQQSALEDWVENAYSARPCLRMLQQLLGPEQFAALGLTGSSKLSEIISVSTGVMEQVGEVWGLGKGLNRSTRRSMRTTKRSN